MEREPAPISKEGKGTPLRLPVLDGSAPVPATTDSTAAPVPATTDSTAAPVPATTDGAAAAVPATTDGAEVRRESSDRDGIPDEQLLRVGDLAQETGKTVRAIHLYEEMGLLTPSRRTKGRYRLFGPDAVVRTRWISKLQELGMSLNDIRAVIREWENLSAPGAMSRMREVYRRQLAETRKQLDRLRTLERELAASLSYLESCDACDPDRLISACNKCELHDEHEHRPDLVAGLSAQISTSSNGSSR